MKKFLSILGALGMTATASTAVVSCATTGSSIKKFNGFKTPVINELSDDNVTKLGLHDVINYGQKDKKQVWFYEFDLDATVDLSSKDNKSFAIDAKDNTTAFDFNWDALVLIGNMSYGPEGTMKGVRLVYNKDLIKAYIEAEGPSKDDGIYTGSFDFGIDTNDDILSDKSSFRIHEGWGEDHLQLPKSLADKG